MSRFNILSRPRKGVKGGLAPVFAKIPLTNRLVYAILFPELAETNYPPNLLLHVSNRGGGGGAGVEPGGAERGGRGGMRDLE